MILGELVRFTDLSHPDEIHQCQRTLVELDGFDLC